MTGGLLMFLVVVIGYLLGAIPFGLLLTRAAGLGDVRRIGSGNIGATNVLRTGNRALAAATLGLDALKGTAAVLIAGVLAPDALIGGSPLSALAAGLGAFLGHLFPVWLRFNGGKGVATYIGVLLGLAWPAALAFCALWVAIAAATRYSSLAALAASAATPLIVLGLGKPAAALVLASMTGLIFLRHSANIRRLLHSEEPRIGARK